MNGKRKSNSRVTTRAGNGLITFEVTGAGTVSLEIGRVSEAVRERAMLHGLTQRILDAAAMSRDSRTGAPPDPEARLAVMKRLIEHYESGTGEWSVRPPGKEVSVLQALANVKFGGDVMLAREAVGRLAESRGISTRILLNELKGASTVTAELARMKGAGSADEALEGLLG